MKKENLKKLREYCNINVYGIENYNYSIPSLLISNHNCLMDIFYVPAIIPNEVVSLISARLIYKPVAERQKMVNDYLYSLPIEAHGGSKYANICLDKAIEILKNGFSVNIFPEGVYVPDKSVIHKGRTGMARILYNCLENNIPINLLPVAIDILSENLDLDSFTPNNEDIVNMTILEPIDYNYEYMMYKKSTTLEEKNIYLHAITDKALRSIANCLNKPYSNEYIELYPKNNVIFANGETIPTIEAQNSKYLDLYKEELEKRTSNLIRTLKRS